MFQEDIIIMPEVKIPYVSGPNEISNEDYHRGDLYSDFVSSTSLKNMMVSPKYFKYVKENGKKIGFEATYRGDMYHELLASITNTGGTQAFLDNHFFFEPPINPKTGSYYGIGTQAWDNEYMVQCQQHPGKEPISKVDYNKTLAMVEELRSGNPLLSPEIEKFLRWGKAEQSHFGIYEGFRFKYRTDLKTRKKIIDWKSISADCLDEQTIAKQIAMFDYHISAAFYQFFDHQLTGDWREFYWVFQQKEPPFDFVIVSANDWSFEIRKERINGRTEKVAYPKEGALKLFKLIEAYKYCKDNDTWPGRAIYIQPDYAGHRIMNTGVPGWVKNNELNIYKNDISTINGHE